MIIFNNSVFSHQILKISFFHSVMIFQDQQASYDPLKITMPLSILCASHFTRRRHKERQKWTRRSHGLEICCLAFSSPQLTSYTTHQILHIWDMGFRSQDFKISSRAGFSSLWTPGFQLTTFIVRNWNIKCL